MTTIPSAPNHQIRRRPGGYLRLMLILALGVSLLYFGLPAGISAFGVRLPTAAAGDQLSWYITRATGTVAYLLLFGSTAWGLLLSSKMIKALVPAALALAMHNYLSWIAIGLSAVHAVALLFDHYFAFSALDLLLPFTGPYNPIGVGLGIIGFYLMAITALTAQLGRWLGPKLWRRLHYLTFVAYGLITVHGLAAGSDGRRLLPMYLVSGLTIFFLTSYRVLDMRAKRQAQSSRVTV